MKQLKNFLTLTISSMAIGLLLGASLAQAQEEVCLDTLITCDDRADSVCQVEVDEGDDGLDVLKEV